MEEDGNVLKDPCAPLTPSVGEGPPKGGEYRFYSTLAIVRKPFAGLLLRGEAACRSLGCVADRSDYFVRRVLGFGKLNGRDEPAGSCRSRRDISLHVFCDRLTLVRKAVSR